MLGHRPPKTPCISCGDLLDAAGNAEPGHKPPEPGDVTVCLNCGHIMAFAHDMTFRELNAEEAREVAGNKYILEAQALRKYLRLNRPT